MTLAQQTASRVLVVDDDEALLRVHARVLKTGGYEVTTAADGTEAVRLLPQISFDVILSDIDMPGMNGIEFLEQVRNHDADVPVVLITGNPTTATAMKAIEFGALQYLAKPVDLKTLLKSVDDAVRLHRIARAKRQALALAGGVEQFIGDQASLTASFRRAMESLYIVYQPIVSSSTKSVFGYEALLRSRERSLPHPGAIIEAAERLGRVHELGRRIREKAIEPLAQLKDNILLFVNLHPSDLLDEELFRADGPLADVASRIVLEITERASLEGVSGVRLRVAMLRKRGFRIAIDDLGAGYAGLSSFALLEPDVVKLDMGLVRDLHREPTKQALVRTMVSMCKELGLVVTSEGIETPEEREAVARTGCDLMQGYLFAKPGAAFPVPSF